MGSSLTEIAQKLKDDSKKVQLIYAFNGTGKTRLSREFRYLVSPKNDESDDSGLASKKIIYYNAFTEDLFYWDNDLDNDVTLKLRIHSNAFTEWVLNEQGQDQNVIGHFQHFTSRALTPRFNSNFTEVTFSYEQGDDNSSDNIKISKGEESNFIWCIFHSLLEQAIEVLNTSDAIDRDTNVFDQLEYVFIDDPVTSLDENHLIELAVDLAALVKSSKSDIKFIITTHNPLFYNVLTNELGRKDDYYSYPSNSLKKYCLEKLEDGTFLLENQKSDSPFSYHLFIKNEIENAIKSGNLKKYHFNFLRNILEKTATFLGHKGWVELLPKDNNGRANPYEKRMLDLFSHSKHSGEEISELSNDDKRVLSYLMNEINKKYQFKENETA